MEPGRIASAGGERARPLANDRESAHLKQVVISQ